MAMTNPWASVRGRHALEVLLKETTKSADPIARETAQEAVSGRHDIRELIKSNAYGEYLASRLNRGAEKWHALSESERQRAIASCEADTWALIASVEEHESRSQPAKPAPEPDDFENISYLEAPGHRPRWHGHTSD
jgi:hypothetical protein